jgi:hypothetical protein
MQIQIGKGIALDVPVDKLPANVMEHVTYIGLRNILMDAHAGITTDEPDYQAKARAVADKGDPVRAEAKRLALAMIKAQVKASGRKFADLDTAKVAEAVNKLITPELLAKAETRVVEAKALAGAVDVSGL